MASATCYALRLHVSAAPPRVGLTQALGANGEATVNRQILTAVIALLPVSAIASTKHLECSQTTDKGVEQRIFATLDDSSDKAEVESFALSAECAKDRSCNQVIYTKDVLPSVIRLTNVMQAGGAASYTSIIDIDRTTLSVVTRTKLLTSVGNSETVARGKCTVKVDNTEKVL